MTRHQNYFAIVFAVSSSSVPVSAALPRSINSVSIFTVGGSECKLAAITTCRGRAAFDEMNDRLTRHLGSEKGSAASGGGSMRKTLSVIEISA